MKKYIPNIILIILLVAVDQLIKVLILGSIGASGESITIIPRVLQLSYVENAGGAWGIFSERIYLIGIDLMIIIAILKLLLDKKYEFDKKAILGMTLILAGGIGNLMDRIIRGFVIDYFDITPILDYPVFNFADICIVVGVILLFIIIIVNTVKSQEKSIDEKV